MFTIKNYLKNGEVKDNFEIKYRGFSSANSSDLVILDINQQNLLAHRMIIAHWNQCFQ